MNIVGQCWTAYNAITLRDLRFYYFYLDFINLFIILFTYFTVYIQCSLSALYIQKAFCSDNNRNLWIIQVTNVHTHRDFVDTRNILGKWSVIILSLSHLEVERRTNFTNHHGTCMHSNTIWGIWYSVPIFCRRPWYFILTISAQKMAVNCFWRFSKIQFYIVCTIYYII